MNALATPLQDEWQDSVEKRAQSEDDWPARVKLGEKRLGRWTGCCQVILAGVASKSTTQCRKRPRRRCCPPRCPLPIDLCRQCAPDLSQSSPDVAR